MSKSEELDFALEEAKEAGLLGFSLPADGCKAEINDWHVANADQLLKLTCIGGVVKVQLKPKDDVAPAPPSHLEKMLTEKAKEEKADAILEPAPEPEAPKLDIPPNAFDGDNLT